MQASPIVLSINPLLQEWTSHFGLPPFDRIRVEDFEPAFEVALAQHLDEIEAITNNPSKPSFDNTLVAFDMSGRLLDRIGRLFHNLTASETSPALQALDLRISPRLAAHDNAIYMHAALFARLDTLHSQRDALALDGEQMRLLERLHLEFVRAGAQLKDEQRVRYGEIVTELASLYTKFSQNLLAEESAYSLELKGEADLAGLPAFLLAATKSAAEQRGFGNLTHVVTLSPSLAESFLTFSSRRDLRETLWRAHVERGASDGEHDNRPIAARIIALRQEQAALHGYPSYAAYELADRMAGKSSAVLELLHKAWEPAKTHAETDRLALNIMAHTLGEPTPIGAWDWRYLAQKVRDQRFDLDDSNIKPYFSLENMISAMFDCAGRLFGVQFVEQSGIPLHHADARLWEVRGSGGAMVGLFIGDNFARPTKRSGAWMGVFRCQSGLDGGTLPIVINNNNFAKAQTTLLSFDDVRALFHEFGHGLHALLSNVRYEQLSGTRVLRDFVELPSQLFENWALEPRVLQRHARHCESGEPIPIELIEKLNGWRQLPWPACCLTMECYSVV